jgi:copper chaperone CopZ
VQSITVDVRVYMHCDACERLVRRTIKKMDGKNKKKILNSKPVHVMSLTSDHHPSVGVETVEVDREENKITVTGDFKAHKLLKKIKKKTGKKAKILIPEPEVNEEEHQEEAEEVHAPYSDPVPDMDHVLNNEFLRPARWDHHYFDDENTEACRIM